MVCTPLDSVHGIFQARILEWAAISCSMGSPWPRNWTHDSCFLHWQAGFFFFFFNHCATWEACMILHRWQNCMELTHTHRHIDTQMRTSKTEEVRIRWVNYININVLALILCCSFEKQNKMFCYPWGKLEKCTKYLSVLFLQMHVILYLSIKFN